MDTGLTILLHYLLGDGRDLNSKPKNAGYLFTAAGVFEI